MILIPPLPIRRPEKRVPKSVAAPPANANLLRVFETIGGALLLMFDRVVIVDPDHPPTTWSFHGNTSIQTGCINYGNSVYLILNGIVNPGDAVILAANDPGARTPEGGYVNAASLTILDI